MLKNCVKCGGKLVGNGENRFHCIFCGWELNLASDDEKSLASSGKLIDDPLFKKCDNPLARNACEMIDGGNFDGAIGSLEKALDSEPENAYAYALMMLCRLEVKSFDELARSGKDFATTTHYKNAFNFGDDEMRRRLGDILAERKYEEALDKFNSATKINYDGDVQRAVDHATSALKSAKFLFKEIYGYKNSAEAIIACDALITFYASDEFWYDYAVNRMKKESWQDYNAAAKILDSRRQYKDAERIFEEYKIVSNRLHDEEQRYYAKKNARRPYREIPMKKVISGAAVIFSIINLAKLLIFWITEKFYEVLYPLPVLFYEHYCDYSEGWIIFWLVVRAAFYSAVFCGLIGLALSKKKYSTLPLPIVMLPISVVLPGYIFESSYYYFENENAIGVYLVFATVVSVIVGAISLYLVKLTSGRLCDDCIIISDEDEKIEFALWSSILLGLALIA